MDDIHKILLKYWGYSSFRPLQEEIIHSVLEKKDTLALLPTGGGKSVCFQVPALAREGICIVISPLIALMQDQVMNLQKKGIKAVAIYSGMTRKEIDIAFDNCAYGDYKFLYLSPERLKTDMAASRIEKMNVNLLAVDEAHCISQWGYDFRPPYLEIAAIREIIPKTPILALTATATADVVDDIMDKLTFPAKNVMQKSFARENLAYVVLHDESKRSKMLDIFKGVPGSGLVYVKNRRRTKEISEFLNRNKIRASYYHGGLDASEREEKQQQWMDDKIRVIVCTNAFGMGIDKPNVRAVVHLEPPESLEAYFQEAGRAGRDGKKSYATLLYNISDKLRLLDSIKNKFPPLKNIANVYEALGNYFQLAIGSGKKRDL